MSNPLNTGWPKIRLKFIAPLRNEHIEATSDHEDYIGLENIQSGTGKILPNSSFQFSEQDVAVKGTANLYYSGDILFGKLRPYLAKALYADRDGICTTELIVLKPRKKIYPKYLLYSILSSNFIEQVDASTIGAKMPRANWEFIGSMKLPVPNYGTQTKIVSYLDRKTAELDQLIGAKQRLLKLLDEKKRALIARAVTRGLNPDTPLKDSGIPWLGMIPGHWEIERAKWLLPEIDERSETGEEDLLSVSHLTGVTLRSEKDVNMFMAESLEGYKKCKAGDLVINTLWAWMGAMGVSPVEGIVSPAYNVYRPVSEIDPDYLDLLVRTPDFVCEITRYSKGVWSSRLRLYPEGLYEAYLPVPPLSEQKEIVVEISKRLNRFKELKSTTEKTIALLQERRTALISAAVTGKLSEEVLDAGVVTQTDESVSIQLGEHNSCLT